MIKPDALLDRQPNQARRPCQLILDEPSSYPPCADCFAPFHEPARQKEDHAARDGGNEGHDHVHRRVAGCDDSSTTTGRHMGELPRDGPAILGSIAAYRGLCQLRSPLVSALRRDGRGALNSFGAERIHSDLRRTGQRGECLPGAIDGCDIELEHRNVAAIQPAPPAPVFVSHVEPK